MRTSGRIVVALALFLTVIGLCAAFMPLAFEISLGIFMAWKLLSSIYLWVCKNDKKGCQDNLIVTMITVIVVGAAACLGACIRLIWELAPLIRFWLGW